MCYVLICDIVDFKLIIFKDKNILYNLISASKIVP